MTTLSPDIVQRLRDLAHALVNPSAARIAVEPMRPSAGYWFGGGNMARAADGTLYLTGRYRNAGDSRTGLDLGDRGKELAIFSSADDGATWTKVLSLDKKAVCRNLDVAAGGEEALSIEGSALRFTGSGVELYVSSEKALPYPEAVADYRKHGTGIWTIERFTAADVPGLAGADAWTVLSCDNPETLHIKDPYLYQSRYGQAYLFFCHHSFNWSSSSTGYVRLGDAGPAGPAVYGCYDHGHTWDVAITRGTCAVPVPSSVAPAGTGLVFYDGGESLRNLDEHSRAVRRPRGYSCEELGGLGYYTDDDPTSFVRISTLFPEFVSPHGTGSIRYVDVLAVNGGLVATWQQSQPDGSQALMINTVTV